MADRADPAALLAAYDAQLRIEGASARSVTRLGPLRLFTYGGGRGWVTYPRLEGVDEPTLRGWVAASLAHYRSDEAITRVEWKTRQHDDAPGLHDALLDHDFVPGEPESIMLGETSALVRDAPLPDGVTLRTVTDVADVRRMCRMLDLAFGEQVSERMAEGLLHRLSLRDGMELWVAESDGEMVAAGRLEPVADSDFAGLWGGATLPPWRGRGLYRALTTARASSALAMGKTLLQSDSTEYSRPILERAGLVKVGTTTPYLWQRG